MAAELIIDGNIWSSCPHISPLKALFQIFLNPIFLMTLGLFLMLVLTFYVLRYKRSRTFRVIVGSLALIVFGFLFFIFWGMFKTWTRC